jgi:hypothetical protein
LNRALRQRNRDPLGRLTRRKLDLAANGPRRRQREHHIRHLGGYQNVVPPGRHGDEELPHTAGCTVWENSAIKKTRLLHAHMLRPDRNVGDLEAPISVGQRAGIGVTFNPHQSARQGFAGGGIADHSMQRRERPVEGRGLRGLSLVLRGVLGEQGN